MNDGMKLIQHLLINKLNLNLYTEIVSAYVSLRMSVYVSLSFES